MLRDLFPRVAVLCCLGVELGCGAGTVGQAVRPDQPTAGGALGEDAKCTSVGDDDQPLIVDWRAHERANLEESLQDGVSVVAYRCGELRVLRGCRIPGSYGFIGTSAKEDVIQLRDADEVTANMPALGGSLLSDLGGSLERGANLELAMVIVGKRRTTIEAAKRDVLVGDERCAGATHFVRGVFVGAFAMGTGTSGNVRVASAIFDASSSSSRLASHRDGAIMSCNSASSSGDAPPPGCAASLRLELRALGQAPRPAAQAGPTAHDTTCPVGMVSLETKCVRPKSSTVYSCDPENHSDCDKQCRAGDMRSCTNLGAHYWTVDGGVTQAAALFEKACTGGDLKGCANFGFVLSVGMGVTENLPRAVDVYRRACTGGSAEACAGLATMYEAGDGVDQDQAQADRLNERACDGGYGYACASVARRYGDRDLETAMSYLERACRGGNAESCPALGDAYVAGKGIRRDPPRGIELLQKSCDDPAQGRILVGACVSLGREYEKGEVVTADRPRAKALFAKACKANHEVGCKELSRMEASSP